MTPLVSVIVPNYNHEAFLKERMDSILSQTFQDFEVILLDDASTDKSPEILRQYSRHPKVTQLVINEKNSGNPFSQWKKGIGLARGKYIWIAESDDKALPEFLSTNVDLMEKNPEMAVSYTACQCIDENGNETDIDCNFWTTGRIRKRIGGVRVHDGKSFVKKNLYWHCYIYNASGALIRKEKIEDGMLDESIGMRASGDWLFWSKLAVKGKVGEIYRKLNLFRRHQKSTTEKSTQSGALYFGDIKVIARIEKNNRIGLYRRIIRHGAFIKFIRRTDTIDDPTREKVLQEFYKETAGGFWEYRLERVHKVLMHLLPGLISMKKDRC